MVFKYLIVAVFAIVLMKNVANASPLPDDPLDPTFGTCTYEKDCLPDFTLTDGNTNVIIGNCLTQTKEGKYWCYVKANSQCAKTPSNRVHGLFYSSEACKTQDPGTVFATDPKQI